MKAKDLMIPVQEHLRPDNTLKEAVTLLRFTRKGEEQVGLKGLTVLDESGRLVGILSMGDILGAVHPAYMDLMELGDFTWDGMVEELAKTIGEKRVFTLMTSDVMTAKEDDPLMDCVDHMLKKQVKKMPVLDETGKVAGMLYERDIFFEIAKNMLNETTGGGQ